jgi:hypothetical protein
MINYQGDLEPPHHVFWSVFCRFYNVSVPSSIKMIAGVFTGVAKIVNVKCTAN